METARTRRVPEGRWAASIGACIPMARKMRSALIHRMAYLAFSVIFGGQTSGFAAHAQSLPEEHFTVERPAALEPAEAEAIYRRMADKMVSGYRLSRNGHASLYAKWQRYNASPYPSATHGSRYVNNYGNARTRSYATPISPMIMPEGAVLAKDSFSVDMDGNVYPGPLFLMEKMAPGFDPEAQDWRYSMIMPDGSFFGVTGGDDDDHVRFCVTCHEAAGDENDHLFFVPEAFRVAQPRR